MGKNKEKNQRRKRKKKKREASKKHRSQASNRTISLQNSFDKNTLKAKEYIRLSRPIHLDELDIPWSTYLSVCQHFKLKVYQKVDSNEYFLVDEFPNLIGLYPTVEEALQDGIDLVQEMIIDDGILNINDGDWEVLKTISEVDSFIEALEAETCYVFETAFSQDVGVLKRDLNEVQLTRLLEVMPIQKISEVKNKARQATLELPSSIHDLDSKEIETVNQYIDGEYELDEACISISNSLLDRITEDWSGHHKNLANTVSNILQIEKQFQDLIEGCKDRMIN